jgi:hypothetical protein
LRRIIRKLSHDLLLLARSLLLVWFGLLPKVRRRDHFLSLRLRWMLSLTLRVGRLVSSSRPLIRGVALRIVGLRVLLRLLATSLRHPRIVVD